MVTVYNAKFWNAGANKEDATPHKGTLEWIPMVKGDPILDSAEEVSPDDLDGQGRHIPKKRN
ncbi:MAG: hypothetical protein WBD95_19165 [Xanthobacteraceae bacterium]